MQNLKRIHKIKKELSYDGVNEEDVYWLITRAEKLEQILSFCEEKVLQNVDPDTLLNENQAAEILNFTVRALQKWRCVGGGPNFIKISGRGIRYRRKDLSKWVGDKTTSKFSEQNEKGV